MTNQFSEDKHVLCRGFLDRETTKTISKYLDYKIRRGAWSPDKNPDVTAYGYYADPLLEVVLETVQPKIEEATGLSLVPTYSFSRVYTEGEELAPHVDRPSCEISATINIASVGKASKIYIRNQTEESSYELEPGDAIVYRGCELTHWRERFESGMLNVQIMLHYVVNNGSNTPYKFDQRPGLGHPVEVK